MFIVISVFFYGRMIMNKKAEVAERAALITATVKHEKTERIPIMSNAWNWKVYDAGFTLSDALYNQKKYTNVLKHYFDNYPADFMFETGSRNPFVYTQYLGSDKRYIIDDEKKIMNVVDESYLEPDEYDELINDPMKFIWEKFLPRKCPNLKQEKNGKVYIDSMYAYINWLNGYLGYGKTLAKNYGVPLLTDLYAPFYMMNGMEIMLDFMRGMRGLSVDLRRQPEKVKAAVEALDSIFEPKMEGYAGPHGHNPDAAFDGAMVFIATSMLSPKQFETFYLPWLNRTKDFAVEHDKTVIIFAEAENSRFYEFLKDLPEGHFAILAEQDDIFNTKKELPNLCVCGGMPVELLGKATPEECVDYAKKLIDELAVDGGYIYSEKKMMSYMTDCKSENLKAVTEFVHDFRI